MKKIIIVLIASLMVLFGCSSTADSGTTELTMMMWDDVQAPAYQHIIDLYEAENPDVNIELQVKPWEEYWTSLETAMQSGTGPDLFILNAPNFTKYTENGNVAPMNDAVQAAGLSAEDFNPATTDIYTAEDGNLYAVPLDYDAISLYYNEQMFADAGIAVPTSWAELEAACVALKAAYPDVVPIAMPINEDQAGYWNFLIQSGTEIVKEDGSTGINSPEGIEALTFLSDLSANGYIIRPDMGELVPEDMLISGQAAMAFGGTWATKTYADSSSAENISAAPIPTYSGTEGEPTCIIHGVGLAVNSASENVEVAQDVATFFGSDEAANILATEAGVIPAKNGYQEVYIETYAVIEGVNTVLESAQYGVAYPKTPGSDWQNTWIEIFMQLMNNAITPEEAAMQMEEVFIASNSR